MSQNSTSTHRMWLALGLTAVCTLSLLVSALGPALAQGGSIVLDGLGDDWDPAWQVTTDPLDVFVTGTGAHPHEAPYYARSGYDATGVWARYQASNDRWYFRTDVDGRAADSDSQTGTAANLGVGTHDVDQGPLLGDSTGVGPPEAYRLRFRFQPGDVLASAELAGDSALLPDAIWPTTLGLAGSAIYSTPANPGIIEWEFARDQVIPAGTAYREMWLWAQMGDNSDIVSDDNVEEVLVLALNLVASCPEAPIVAGDEATFPLDYAIPSSAALGATAVMLRVEVPDGTTFVSASDGGTESAGMITWQLGDLAPGDAGQVTFTLRTDAQLTGVTITSEMTCAEGLRFQASNECPVQQPPPSPTPIPPETPPVVPEPSTITLMLAGLGGLGSYAALHWRARRRR